MGTHSLESADRGTCQAMESNQESKGHSHPRVRGVGTPKESKQENNKSIE
jgi:hypothetical protein